MESLQKHHPVLQEPIRLHLLEAGEPLSSEPPSRYIRFADLPPLPELHAVLADEDEEGEHDLEVEVAHRREQQALRQGAL